MAAAAPTVAAKPRDGEVACKLPKVQRFIGRLYTNARGGPSIACRCFAAAMFVLKGIDSVAEVVEVTSLYIWSRDSAVIGQLADVLQQPLDLIGLPGFERALVVGPLFTAYDYYLVPAFNKRERSA